MNAICSGLKDYELDAPDEVGGKVDRSIILNTISIEILKYGLDIPDSGYRLSHSILH